MGLWNLIVRFFQGGGDFMYPIAVVFVFGAGDCHRALHLPDADCGA